VTALKGTDFMSNHEDSPAQGFLRHSLLSVLMMDAAGQLDFWCNGVHVSGAGLKTVYWALMTHQLGVAINQTLRPDLAMYMPDFDTFVFQRYDFGAMNSTIDEKGLLVHESIHAMVDVAHMSTRNADLRNTDLAPWTLVTTSASEVVAYIAQSMFYLNFTGSQLSTDRPIHIIAGRIAAKLKDQPGAFVSADDAQNLEAVILDNGDYHERLLTNNILVANGVN
jgi:hypothetical protein